MMKNLLWRWQRSERTKAYIQRKKQNENLSIKSKSGPL
jgi:hypothetical protein